MRLGNKVASPTLVVIASKEGDDAPNPDLGTIWSRWADEVRITYTDTDHHIAEEDPSGLAAILHVFLTAR